MEIFYAQKKLGKKNKHDADHTSALAAHTTFSHHFLPENAAGKIAGQCKPDSGKRGGCGHAFLHCRKEISADAPEECIKAQCVIARTNLKAAEEMGTELPGSMTMGELQELWGDYFSEAEGKIKEAIQETDGETLQYRNHYIYAAYHAVSAGNTRNIEELYPDSDMPYLSGVACYEDAQSPDYLSVLYLDQEITIEEEDSAGYVTKAQMNGKSYTGEELRGELGLKSANFTVTELEPGKIRIVTKGHGHGFGLSQYTAQKMAEKGEDYRNILQYFFPGTELENVE